MNNKPELIKTFSITFNPTAFSLPKKSEFDSKRSEFIASLNITNDSTFFSSGTLDVFADSYNRLPDAWAYKKDIDEKFFDVIRNWNECFEFWYKDVFPSEQFERSESDCTGVKTIRYINAESPWRSPEIQLEWEMFLNAMIRGDVIGSTGKYKRFNEMFCADSLPPAPEGE